MRGQILDWEMSLRYKYPTINTDTYRMNEEREWKGDEELRRGWEEQKIDQNKRRV